MNIIICQENYFADAQKLQPLQDNIEIYLICSKNFQNDRNNMYCTILVGWRWFLRSFNVKISATWLTFLNLQTYHDSTNASQCGSDTNAVNKCETYDDICVVLVWPASSLAIMRKSGAPSDPRGYQSESENERAEIGIGSAWLMSGFCILSSHLFWCWYCIVVFLVVVQNIKVGLNMMNVCDLTHLLGF